MKFHAAENGNTNDVTRSSLGESWSVLDVVRCCNGTNLLPYCEGKKIKVFSGPT